ncbi:hypothetical protein QYE76_067676 [Lolium multiflorum]|uniref:F-box domain-containing protein n=1 Tax=Lolium multiflorum TaxID=4521 RepID=A0AAD8SEB5_LOLMU|nr:hypothetical protein QYE76_067676 [Lolium multiflorum]
MGALVVDLPDDVLVAILVLLPTRSIELCRKVCRAWRSAISHPSFDAAHAQRQATVAAHAQRPASVVKVTDYREGHFSGRTTNIDFELFRGRWHPGNVHRNRARPRTIILPRTACSVRARGSWGGVVCIELRLWTMEWFPFDDPPPPPYPYPPAGKYVLWNPVSKACAAVSPPADGGEIMGGYSHPSTGRFHLVHASGETGVDRLIAPTNFRILRVGRDAVWREIPLERETKISMAGHQARCVRSHGNLHWLVLWGSESALRLLTFDTTREKFRVMEAPPRPRRREGDEDDLTRARLGVLSGGELCTFIVEPSTSTMAVWVLDDYKLSIWRLKERIGLVSRDKSDLSRSFSMDTEVEVVEGVREGEEIFLHHNDGTSRIDAYNLGRKEWRIVNFAPWVFMLMHSVSILPHRVSFGDAPWALSRTDDRYRHNLQASLCIPPRQSS